MVTLDEFIKDREATALLVIDMQNDFLLPDAPVPAPGGLEAIPRIAALAEECRRAGFPVIYTQEMHRPDLSDYGIELEFEPAHCIEGTGGADIVRGLEPQPGDVRISKRRYDAFLNTDLDLVLRTRGIRNLLIVGVCTDICVLSTTIHARNLDYRCFVLSDAVAGTSQERHRAAFDCLSLVIAYVGPTDEVASAFGLQVPSGEAVTA